MDTKNNRLRYGDKINYYRPLLCIDKLWMQNKKIALDFLHSVLWEEYHTIRAKAYELFNYNCSFVSDDYKAIRGFIENHYNVARYHEKNKEWTFKEYKKGKRYYKERIKNVVEISRALFGERKTTATKPDKNGDG